MRCCVLNAQQQTPVEILTADSTRDWKQVISPLQDLRAELQILAQHLLPAHCLEMRTGGLTTVVQDWLPTKLATDPAGPAATSR